MLNWNNKNYADVSLHDAIDFDRYETIEKLSKIPAYLNYKYRGYTPLQYSLLHEKYTAALIILKQAHVDVNQICTSNYEPGKTIWPYLKHSRKPIVKLLALHGANIDDINLKKEQDEIKQYFLSYQALYNEICRLKTIINPSNLEDSQEARQQLNKIWKKLSEEEEINEFKIYYKENALLALNPHFADTVKENKQSDQRKSTLFNSIAKCFKWSLPVDDKEDDCKLQLLNESNNDLVYPPTPTAKKHN